MRFQLSPKGVKLAEEFEHLYGDKECGCVEPIWPDAQAICNRCMHPGNPINIQEDDSNITNILISKDDPYEDA